MNSSALRSLNSFLRATGVFAGGALLFVQAEAAVPNPCSLVTAAEMQAIVGKLSGTPRATDPASERSPVPSNPSTARASSTFPCTTGTSRHGRPVTAARRRCHCRNLAPMLSPIRATNDWVDLYAKKGAVILRVTLPTGPKSMDMAKAIAKKALSRL